MTDYAMRGPTRDGKYFLPCLSIMFPISGSETWPAGYNAAEGQARNTGNGDELESQIPQKQNPRSLVTKPRAMKMTIPTWVKWFSEERWEMPVMQHVIRFSFIFFCQSFCKILNNHTNCSALLMSLHGIPDHWHFLYYYRIFSSREISAL